MVADDPEMQQHLFACSRRQRVTYHSLTLATNVEQPIQGQFQQGTGHLGNSEEEESLWV